MSFSIINEKLVIMEQLCSFLYFFFLICKLDIILVLRVVFLFVKYLINIVVVNKIRCQNLSILCLGNDFVYNKDGFFYIIYYNVQWFIFYVILDFDNLIINID